MNMNGRRGSQISDNIELLDTHWNIIIAILHLQEECE